jgi:hypothetical protein
LQDGAPHCSMQWINGHQHFNHESMAICHAACKWHQQPCSCNRQGSITDTTFQFYNSTTLDAIHMC